MPIKSVRECNLREEQLSIPEKKRKEKRNESGCQKLAEKKRAVLCDGEWCWKLAEECGQGLALTGAHEQM